MRPKLTYANVVATLALFIAIGGASAFAASQLGKNTVGSKQLKKNAVITAKIKKEAVTGAKVKKGTLTGTQIDTSTLGTVPSAGNANTAATASVASSLAAPEAWHIVGAPGEPPFQNGCQANEERPPRFFKDHEGVVHLEGVYAGCTSAGENAYQLPPGYRPETLEQFPLIGGPGNIAVWPSVPGDPPISGVVKCGGAACILDGVTFRAES